MGTGFRAHELFIGNKGLPGRLEVFVALWRDEEWDIPNSDQPQDDVSIERLYILNNNKPNAGRELLFVCIKAAGQFILDTVVESICGQNGDCDGSESDQACSKIDERARVT